MATYLAPVAKPKGLMLKLAYVYTRRQFGQVPGPLSVFCARMPTAFTRFYMKAGMLEKKLKLASETAVLIRERVASTNMCLYCMDANRWSAINKAGVDAAKLDALTDYQTSPLFSDSERAALAFATELTEDRHVPTTSGVIMTGSSSEGIKTVLHPVSDLAAAKAVYAALLGVPPQTDEAYYVGFEAAGQHIGLVPGGGPQGMTSPVAYWHVPDIEAKLAEVTAAGATVKEPASDVGGGRLVATVTDPDGNVLGLLQDREVLRNG